MRPTLALAWPGLAAIGVTRCRRAPRPPELPVGIFYKAPSVAAALSARPPFLGRQLSVFFARRSRSGRLSPVAPRLAHRRVSSAVHEVHHRWPAGADHRRQRPTLRYRPAGTRCQLGRMKKGDAWRRAVVGRHGRLSYLSEFFTQRLRPRRLSPPTPLFGVPIVGILYK